MLRLALTLVAITMIACDSPGGDSRPCAVAERRLCEKNFECRRIFGTVEECVEVTAAEADGKGYLCAIEEPADWSACLTAIDAFECSEDARPLALEGRCLDAAGVD